MSSYERVEMRILERNVCVRKLMERANYLDGQVWGCESISIKEIQDAVLAGTDCIPPYNTVKSSAEPDGGWRAYHIARIACLARNEIDDDLGQWAIRISVDHELDTVTIEEGRHRVIAAFVRGQPTVDAKVYELADGDYDLIF